MTRAYLSKVPNDLFWKFWLGIPYLIWMYSIVVELNKRNSDRKELIKVILLGLMAYQAIYIPVGLILLISGKADMDLLMPFHIGAMICFFLLIILTSITILKFEKAEKLKQSNGLGLLFGIWFFIFGIWHIQPKLNQYVKRIK